MKIYEDQQTVVLVDFDWWWALGGVISLLFLLWHVIWHPMGLALSAMPIFIWAIFCALFFWLGTYSEFVFDKQKRLVRWKRLGILGRRQGELSFKEIFDVELAREWTDLDMPSERIFLVTADRRIPIQTGLTLDPDPLLWAALAKLQKLLRPPRRTALRRQNPKTTAASQPTPPPAKDAAS